MFWARLRLPRYFLSDIKTPETVSVGHRCWVFYLLQTNSALAFHHPAYCMVSILVGLC